MSLRKSSAARPAKNGNTAKYLSYREAWAPIYQAHASGFYLEAVTIAESIIGDRMLSYLVRANVLESTSPKRWPSHADLVHLFRKMHPESISEGGIEDLLTALEDWGRARNHIVHEIVRLRPGQATRAIDEFLQEAELTAIRGAVIARALCSWTDRMKRKRQPVTN
jgi:hypothetical protein